MTTPTKNDPSAEAALRRECEFKDEFLSHVVHELRTPLTAVMQFVTILSDGIAGPVNAEQVEYLGIIERSADRLKRMISTLMDVTRAVAGQLECIVNRVAIEPIIERSVRAFELVAGAKNVTLTTACPDSLPEVMADAPRIEQMLGHLLENAIEFSPAGGTVHIEISGPEGSCDEIVVAVRDHGSGVCEAARERIFDPPQDRESGGGGRRLLGAGLYLCREIIALHGGRIWVESVAGQGSCFRFTLPR